MKSPGRNMEGLIFRVRCLRKASLTEANSGTCSGVGHSLTSSLVLAHSLVQHIHSLSYSQIGLGRLCSCFGLFFFSFMLPLSAHFSFVFVNFSFKSTHFLEKHAWYAIITVVLLIAVDSPRYLGYSPSLSCSL